MRKDDFINPFVVFFEIFGIFGWLMGMVLAKGGWFWLALFIPPYAWYLVTERLMQAWGLV
jgi:hypothetical protein